VSVQPLRNLCNTVLSQSGHALFSEPSLRCMGVPMKPLLLRDELPPDDAIVVVRGGEMNSVAIERTATRSFEEFGIWAVSVFLATNGTVGEVCRTVPDLERYGKVRLSTAGRLRSHGFVLIPTMHAPHFDVVLPDIDPATLDRLDGAFDSPIPNPARGR
jgi:hypothetical protein